MAYLVKMSPIRIIPFNKGLFSKDVTKANRENALQWLVIQGV